MNFKRHLFLRLCYSYYNDFTLCTAGPENALYEEKQKVFGGYTLDSQAPSPVLRYYPHLI